MEEGTVERLILVVEANLNHAELIKQVLAANTTQYHIVVVPDGTEAIDFLHQNGQFANAPRPHLILLDLNLPNKDGWEVLAEIKADTSLKRIPVIILTASNHEDDIFKTYERQGNCYVIKSHDLEQLTAIIKRIEAFWLEIVTLPTE